MKNNVLGLLFIAKKYLDKTLSNFRPTFPISHTPAPFSLVHSKMTTTRSQRMAKAMLTSSKSQISSIAPATSNTAKSKWRKNNTMKRAATTAVTLAAATVTSSNPSSVMPIGVAALTTSPYFSKTPSRTCSSTRKKATTLNAARKTTPSPSTPPSKKKKKSSPSASKSATKKPKTPVKRTNSFEPMWLGNFPDEKIQQGTKTASPVDVHTLILGTHPSIRSLSEEQYYGHPMNAFWWIAGDCFGFRRSTGISPSSGEPYKFTSTLRYGADKVIPYEEQIRIMAQHGFAMWDIISSCKREGSLDSAIEQEIPNDIEGFCKKHPSIRRVVLANGSTGSKYFVKHFKSWWESGQLCPGNNRESQTAFHRKALAKVTNNYENATITCISAVSVSPAAASYSYEQKRDFWEAYVYQPGLQDFKEMQFQSK